MQKNDIDGMSINVLWDLHLEVSELLRKQLTAELLAVERRLHKLRARAGPGSSSKQRSRRNGRARVATKKKVP